jgi:hypothetical protein
MTANPSQIDSNAAEKLTGWNITPKAPRSSPGQQVLFESGDGLSRSVKKSIDQGQRLLFDADHTPTKEA